MKEELKKLQGEYEELEEEHKITLNLSQVSGTKSRPCCASCIKLRTLFWKADRTVRAKSKYMTWNQNGKDLRSSHP